MGNVTAIAGEIMMRRQHRNRIILLMLTISYLMTGCSELESESTAPGLSDAKDAIYNFFVYSGEDSTSTDTFSETENVQAVKESEENLVEEVQQPQESEENLTEEDTTSEFISDVVEMVTTAGRGELIGSTVLKVNYSGNAAYNVNLACEYNYHVQIPAGGSYNAFSVLGDGGKSMGFKEADGLLSDGSRVPMYGSGICPVTTAIYQAGREAGLTIIEASDHVGADSVYADAGDQAMFNYPTSNLIMRNDYDYTVTLYTVYQDDAIYAQWYAE